MNNERCKEIKKALAMLDEAKSLIEACAEGEREYFDNMPESMQSGEKGQKADETATELEDVTGVLEDIIFQLETVTE